MSRNRHLLTALILGSAVAVTAAAVTEQPTDDSAVPADAQEVRATTVTPEPAEAPLYGPIHAKDPAVRAQIKQLYVQQRDASESATLRLQELNDRLLAETDPDFQWQIHREIAAEKDALELRHVELGLEIAVLNGDERRAAEFRDALDRLQHPEKYLPPRPPKSDREVPEP